MRNISKINKIYTILILFLFVPCHLFAETHVSAHYKINVPRLVPSGGQSSSVNYMIKNAVIGRPFGGSSESNNFKIYADYFYDIIQRLSISLNPLSWQLKSIPGESFKVSLPDERIVLKNDGNVRETISIQVIDSAGTWMAGANIGENTLNRYLMSAILTDTDVLAIEPEHFNETGAEDLMLESTPQLATDIKYASTISVKNGVSIAPNEERYLWLKFDAPAADTTNEQHDIWVIVGAELSE
ncbi:MAG: hypothetical protein HQ575_07835 [Candidatus Omnitrophica bacterium]|nr:hypothetical protein [Candidatus Omnitrophota bacterium]